MNNPYAHLSPDSISICPCGCTALVTTREALRMWNEMHNAPMPVASSSKEDIEDWETEYSAWCD